MMNSNRRKIALAIGALMMATSTSFAFTQASNQEPIRIGAIESLSGAFASIGTLGAKGAQLAADNVKVLGRPVQIIVEDDQSNPKVGAQKARKLISQDKVVALQGMAASTIGAAVSNVASQEKVPLIIEESSATELTGKGCRRSTFRVRSPALPMLNSIVPYLLKTYGHKWYFVAYDYSWGHEVVSYTNKILKKVPDAKILDTDLVSVGTQDYSSYFLKIRQQKPDVIFTALGGSDMAAFIKQFGEFGLDKTMILSGAVMDTSVAWQLGDAMRGVWPNTFIASDPNAKPFVDLYVKKYGEIPGNEAWAGFIATKSLIGAIEKAQTTEFDGIVKALEGMKIDLYKPGEGYYRAFDHQLMQNIFVLQTKKGVKKGDLDWADVVGIAPSKGKSLESIAGTKDEIGCVFK